MRRLFKVLLILLSALIAAIVVALIVGSIRLGAAIDVPAHDAPPAVQTAAASGEGRRLTEVFSCTECHAGDVAGQTFIDAGPFMTLAASNLTGGRWSAAQLERAVRHGVGADGRALLLMPSDAYAQMSDDDLAAMSGYILSLPDVQRDLPARRIGPVARIIGALTPGTLQHGRRIAHEAAHPRTRDNSAQAYLPLCAACHGADLGGSVFAGGVWAPNLTADATGLADWDASDFERALRQGKSKDGRELNDKAMPWPGFASMTDDEVAAIWQALRDLPPVVRSQPQS